MGALRARRSKKITHEELKYKFRRWHLDVLKLPKGDKMSVYNMRKIKGVTKKAAESGDKKMLQLIHNTLRHVNNKTQREKLREFNEKQGYKLQKTHETLEKTLLKWHSIVLDLPKGNKMSVHNMRVIKEVTKEAAKIGDRKVLESMHYALSSVPNKAQRVKLEKFLKKVQK